MTSWRYLPLPLLFLLLPCLLSRWPCSSAAASDTLAVGESLTGNQTLVSAGGQFELGFFSPSGGNSNNHYIGIWYKQIPGQTVIWVMNRDSPIADPSSAELTVAPDGNLLLLQTGNRSQEAIWSSNSTGSGDDVDDDTAAAVLLDSGNLVLRSRRDGGNSSAVIWQSFDHPTDTLMPGGWVGLNKRTGAYQTLRSWRSATDPSTGLYMDRVKPGGLGQYEFVWNNTAIYLTVGSWNGRYFVPIPEMVMSDKYTFTYVNNSEEVSYSFKVNDPSTLSRLVMSPHGQLTMWDWSEASGPQWLLHWAFPTSQCDGYSVCGSFGLCDVANSQYCRCLPGFQPASPGDWVSQTWSAGCARKTSLQCGGNASSTDGFLPAQNVKLPSSYSPVADARSAGDCASACLRNCSCTAYAYYGGACLVWGGDVRNAQQLAVGDPEASTLFLRVAAADLAAANQNASTNGRVAILVVLCVIAVAVLCLLFVLAWVRRREGTVYPDGSLLVFSHGYLAQCTKNFSHKLGSGSFGSVYKGTLPGDHTAIAVKRLEGSAQGEKQFRTEVRTLGTIQHVNLVRLRGFCATTHDRLLVYDYMPNGSLASVLSSGHSFRLLDWRARFGIMVGVARGLAYLHEQCHERIVHCDVKPENILLDATFCPKVADFGMAKLIVRDFSQALTTTRGTVGYLAPEWILGMPITAKADVFSYGMMLLELISGRRNRDAVGRGSGSRYFPVWAATKVREGQFLELLDERLEGDADVEELERASNVACWCIQQSEEHRPTMGQVVQVLEGSLRAGTAPVPRFLEQLCAEDSYTL